MKTQTQTQTTLTTTTGRARAPVRNIGVAAHIDAGKTTLSERILFYSGRIHAMGEVHDRSRRGGATMDSMVLERKRGITIQSAATHLRWGDAHINLIDTPGHVDFTVEVERSLQVLDGAVLVVCATSGVQAQTLTVDRQMRRHRVPRLAFINKMDRAGAAPFAVVEQLRERLGLEPVIVNIPIGTEAAFRGVVCVIRGCALYFEGDHGEHVREAPCPPELVDTLTRYRAELVERLAEHDEELLERYLAHDEADVAASSELISRALRRATIAMRVVPVLFGAAYKNRGVQPLLDAVVQYLPAPGEVTTRARDPEGHEVALTSDPEAPLCALAFKIEDRRFGALTYVRVYQGSLSRGQTIYNVRTGDRLRVGRLVRMHADAMEDIDALRAGDIGALFGAECPGGDSLGDGRARLSLGALTVPEPVIHQAIAPADKRGRTKFSRALGRFTREDPSLRVWRDHESGETILAGMGELHLEIYRERMQLEYGVETRVSAPRVAYRETLSGSAATAFNHLHKKQEGGTGQYARVVGFVRPLAGSDAEPTGAAFRFVNQVTHGRIPGEYIPACEQGARDALVRGPALGAPVVGLEVVLTDGATHVKDSSPLAFRTAARTAVAEAVREASTVVLEPVMRVEITTPAEYRGAVQGSVMKRRGQVIDQRHDAGADVTLVTRIPLAELFGYAGALRSLTRGAGTFTAEPADYASVPPAVQAALIREREEERSGRASRKA